MAYETSVVLFLTWMQFSVIFSNLEEESPVDYSGIFKTAISGYEPEKSKIGLLFLRHKILSIHVDTDEKIQHVINLQKTYQDGVKYWEYHLPVEYEVNLHVNKEHANLIENKIKEHNLTYHVACKDLGKLFRSERSSPRDKKLEEFGYNFGKHNDFETIQNYLLQITRHNQNTSKLSVIGNSFEKRPLYSVQIPRSRSNPKTIVFECGIHAREWTSVEACIYMIKKFINPDQSDRNVKAILSCYDIIIIPVINPDGYDYSWKKDRMWRKTRSCNEEECKGLCVGVDGNRNFDVNFGQDANSPGPCRADYPGKRPFSESETAAVRDLIQRLGRCLFAYFSIHSAGAMWLTPYAKTQAFPKNYMELKRVGNIGAAAIREVNGLEFQVGSSTSILYKCSGTSMDYAHDTGKAEYTYTLELRHGTMVAGFILDEREIIPMCKETFEGIKAAILAFKKCY